MSPDGSPPPPPPPPPPPRNRGPLGPGSGGPVGGGGSGAGGPVGAGMPTSKMARWAVWAVVIAAGLALLFVLNQSSKTENTYSYTEFLTKVSDGDVHEV